MNRRIKTMGVAALLSIALLVAAARTQGGQAPTEAPQPVRIAYVDLDRVAADSEMVKQRVASVEEDLQVKQKAFQAKADELRQLRQQVTQQESVLTAAQLEQKQARIRQLRDEMEYLQYQANKVFSDTSRDVIEPVLDEVLQAVERVAQVYKVDLVLRGDLVLFASERIDLTDAVVRDLDRVLKAASKAPPSPAKPPARRSSERMDTKKP
ncbi:MAG: hypothetical protein AMJ84_05165 [Acidithiobacillales bacterium SM23_46]|nr:MAG: hypothetical protein AMJ84_05165 [Acidithiobacillales bacterium SM23_46]